MVDDDEQPHTRAPRRRWAWWHRQTTTTRRVIRTTLALVLTGMLSAVLGILTASADSSLGPHAAHYEITPQHEIVADLGPLGTVLIDSPLPWPLGVEVVVGEIPLELAGVSADPVTGLAGDLAAYVQAASQPEAVIADAAAALVRDAVGRTVLVWSGLLVVIAVGRLASRGMLRREVNRAVRRPGVVPLAAAVVVCLLAVPTVTAVRERPAVGTTISALAGTPVADLRMTGRIAGLIDTYGGYLVDAVEENDAFYASVSENLEAAYAQNRAPARPPGIPVFSPAPTDTATEEGTPLPDDVAPDEVEDDAETATAPPTADPVEAAPTDPPARAEPVTFLFVTDLHCNVGMASVIADTLRLSGAQALLDGGDTVMSGTTVESYCVNAFAGAIPDDVPMVVSTGNHDSITTAEQLRDAGYTVLGGDVAEVAGVRILGDTDPTLTAIGEGTRPERDETVPEMGLRLADTACSADRVDLMLVHDPRAALPSVREGCVPLALSGHWHRRSGPEVVGTSPRYVSASSGGASGGVTVGPLNGPAEMTVLRFDAANGRPLDYRVITVGTDATVDLGRWYRFPEPADSTPSTGDTGESGPAEGPTDAETPAGTERR